MPFFFNQFLTVNLTLVLSSEMVGALFSKVPYTSGNQVGITEGLPFSYTEVVFLSVFVLLEE